MNTIAKHQLIAEVIEHALEDLSNWKPPTPRKGVGPGYPEVFKEFAEGLGLFRDDLSRTLERCSVEALRQDFPPSTTPCFNPLFDRNGLYHDLADRLADLKASIPANYVGGWAITEKEVDLAYWRGHACYSLTEAALLSVGRDPRMIIYDELFKSFGRSEKCDAVLYFLEDTYERIAAGFGLDSENQNAKVGVDEFLSWVERNRVQIDPRFRRMLKERRPRVKDTSTTGADPVLVAEKVPHGSTQKTFVRVICTMAIKRYGLDDEKKIRKVARDIQHDGDMLGLAFDSETVRKWLVVGFQRSSSMRKK